VILGAFLLGGVVGYVLHAALHLYLPHRSVRPLAPRTGVAEPPSGVTILGPQRPPDDPEPVCNGICTWASDLIDCAPAGIAYAHPECPLHGQGADRD
jgi:hypothetical protein